MKIIDAHAHIAQYVCGFTSRGELRSVGGGKAQYATGEVFQMFPPELGDTGVSPEALIKVMDENCVEKAVLLQGNFLGFQNEYSYLAVKKYPDRFTVAGTYDPFCVKVNEIRNLLLKEVGFKAVKFELSDGSGLMANRSPVNLDGETMHGCFAHASDNGLIVVLDIGRPRSPCWQVENLARAIKKYPQTAFVICHLLAPQREDKELLKTALGKLVAPNVYFDLASLASNQKPEVFPYPSALEHLRTAKSVVGADKLIFGTDMPCTLARDSYKHLCDYITDSAVFTENELEDIFYNTANSVFFDI